MSDTDDTRQLPDELKARLDALVAEYGPDEIVRMIEYLHRSRAERPD